MYKFAIINTAGATPSLLTTYITAQFYITGVVFYLCHSGPRSFQRKTQLDSDPTLGL